MIAKPTTRHAITIPTFASVDSPKLIFSTGALELDVLLGDLDEAVDKAEDELVIPEEELISVVVEGLKGVGIA